MMKSHAETKSYLTFSENSILQQENFEKWERYACQLPLICLPNSFCFASVITKFDTNFVVNLLAATPFSTCECFYCFFSKKIPSFSTQYQ